jgi:hypothetical protein
MMNEEMISYAHRDEPNGVRFWQYKKDSVPVWAIDIRDEGLGELSPYYDEQAGLDF